MDTWNWFGRAFDPRPTLLPRSSFCYAGPEVFPNISEIASNPDMELPYPGFNQAGPTGTACIPSTLSKNRMDEYYTPEVQQRVKDAFAMDYVVWNELQKGHDPVDVPAAGDLQVVQSNMVGANLRKTRDGWKT